MPTHTRRFLSFACLSMLCCIVPLHLLGVSISLASTRSSLMYLGAAATTLGVLVALDKAPLLRFLVEVTTWSMLIGTLVNLPVALLVRMPVPFVDHSAASLDAHLGIHAADWVRFAQRHPRFDWLCSVAYISLRPVDILTLYLPVLCRKPRWSSELFVALVLQLFATVTIMLFAQGVGPWLVNGVTPTPRQAEISDIMLRFKAAPHILLDMGDIPGFVAFPSWHVMLAMLAAFTIGRIRALRAPSIAWLVLVAVSTLTTGWHYGIDVLSGLLVGGSCILGSQALHRHWDARANAKALVPRGYNGQVQTAPWSGAA